MNKRALILDLDNTIYPVSSIGEELFRDLFRLIEEHGAFGRNKEAIKRDIMSKPFQRVAREHHFSEELTRMGIELLEETTYDKEMTPFEDYKEIRELACEKFLVTTGFTRMQRSKVRQLGIEQDFKEIHIIDPKFSDKSKKDVFLDILQRNRYKKSDVLVVGDDPNSEIKAAKELGLEAVLYDKENNPTDLKSLNKIYSFKDLTWTSQNQTGHF
jgi:putative hydrolase of the HAD superfamily